MKSQIYNTGHREGICLASMVINRHSQPTILRATLLLMIFALSKKTISVFPLTEYVSYDGQPHVRGTETQFL